MAPRAQTAEQTATTNADGTPAKPAKSTTLVSITVPNELKDILDKVAAENDKATAAYVRDLVAKSVNYELPPMTRAKRSATPMTEEQRKAAAKEKSHKASALLKALEAGELGDLDLDAILSKYKPQERAPRSTTANAETEPANANA